MTSQIREGSHTPWGGAQQVDEPITGIALVSTASHGGARVSAERLAEMPAQLREIGAGGWFEEDCAIDAVAYVFPEAFTWGGQRPVEEVRESAASSLRDWFPDQWEALTGTELAEGESFMKDKRLFHERNADRFIVISAWGGWHDEVPDGMVGVLAIRGGRDRYRKGGGEGYFLVPADEYDASDFLIDEERHQPWPTRMAEHTEQVA